jgi:hypothetical protein
MNLAFVLAVLGLFASSSLPVEFFVSPSGSDQNPGTREKPFQSLVRARDALRSVRKNTGLPVGGATIWLGQGTYRLDSTFRLDSVDGGSADRPLTYRAFGEVRITGSRQVPPSAFHGVSDKKILARLPEVARQTVVEADLKALGSEDYGRHRQFGHGLPVVPAPMELFWNDSVLQLARYPNTGAILMGDVVDTGSVPRIGDYSNRGGTFHYTDPRHARWAGVPDVWFQGFFHYGFADDKIRVAGIDTATREVHFASPHMYGLGSGENFNQYVALNLLEELDEPGEWYVDRSTGRLFVWPPSDLKSARIEVSIVEKPLISMRNCSCVTLRGMIIECGRAIGIYMEGGEGNHIEDCTVRNVGTVGIMLGQGARQTFPHVTADDYTGVPVSEEVGSFQSYYYMNTVWDRHAGKNQSISGCEVHATGSGGIILGGGSKKDLVSGGNEASDCRIHDFDRRNKAGAAGINIDGCGNRIVHNEIYNGDLQAIMVRGNEHLFEFNLIHHVARNSNDASAWYLGRDPSDRGNVVRYNFFHHVGRPDRKWTMGVYCDDATCGVLIEGNIFYRVASYGTVYSNGGHDIVVRNNIFVEGYGPAFQLKSMWYDFAIPEISYYFGPTGIYTRRLTKAVEIKAPPYSVKYPNLRDWLDLLPDGKTYVGMRPRRNVVDRNVLVRYEETFRLVAEYAQCDYGKNYITQQDPGFVDAANMDFRLKDGSVVYKEVPGFVRIPFEEIGPRKKAGALR